MKSWKSIPLTGICCLLLTGCARESDNFIANVEEIPTTREITKDATNENITENEGDTLNGVPLDLVSRYLSDEHFCNQSESDFIGYEEGARYHIKVSEAYVSDDPALFGQYFSSMEAEMNERMRYLETVFGYDSGELTYLCLPVEITNIGEQTSRLGVGKLNITARVDDDRLAEYGLADKCLSSVTPDIRSWYDYPDKVDNGKSYYMVDMEPEETISTNIVYIIEKSGLEQELYICLYYVNGIYDKKLKCELPPADREVMYIRVNIQGGQ